MGDLLLQLMDQSCRSAEVANELENFCHLSSDAPVLGDMINTKLRQHGIRRIARARLAEMLQETSGLAKEEAVRLIDGFLGSDVDATNLDPTVECTDFFAWLYKE